MGIKTMIIKGHNYHNKIVKVRCGTRNNNMNTMQYAYLMLDLIMMIEVNP